MGADRVESARGEAAEPPGGELRGVGHQPFEPLSGDAVERNEDDSAGRFRGGRAPGTGGGRASEGKEEREGERENAGGLAERGPRFRHAREG